MNALHAVTAWQALGVLVLLGWVALFVLVAAAAWASAYVAIGNGRRPEPMTAPGPAHPASRALAARKSWVDADGDHFADVVPVAEVVPFVEPPCTCGYDDAILAGLEGDFSPVQQQWALSLNRDLSNLPYRSQP